MIAGVLRFALHQRVLVLSLAAALCVWGVVALRALPIDAFPDVTNIQVQILTEAPGFSPVEVERFVTFPIELQMTGLPGLADIRSLSKFGLSQITVIFQDHVDVYFARQIVLERMLEAQALLPEGVQPELAPVTTGLGEVYQYFLERTAVRGEAPLSAEQELMRQRTIQDWIIRPALKSVPGVIEVNSIGGFVKQYQVIVDPAKLLKYGLTIRDVFTAVSRNNANAGGNILERHAEKFVVRGLGLIRTIADIEDIVLREKAGVPVFVRDVALVRIGHAVRHGAAVLNGEREVVAGVVLMLRGENARAVVQHVEQKVDAIHKGGLLPAGLRIVPFYDRSELVEAALRTVSKALLEGIGLVIVVLFLFLGNVRSALIVIATLIVTPLATFIIMGYAGLSANLMSLGGLAIAIGMIVDGSVVVVENIYRHVSMQGPGAADRRAVALRAAREVGQPVVFGILIICVVFLPLLALQGMEGKMFAPMAYTIMIALLVSLLLSLTLSPVLASLMIAGGGGEDAAIVRWTRRAYLPALRWALSRPRLVQAVAAGLLLLSLALVPFIGTEFIPTMDEGAVTPQIIRLPSTSLEQSIALEKQAHRALLEFPEVRMAVGKIGRSEIALAPEEANESDPVVTLHPRDQWTTASSKRELVDAMRRRLAQIPGISVLMSQPIQERVDELLSGIKTEVAIKLYGDDLETLKYMAERIATIMSTVRGVADLKVEQIVGQTYLSVDIDRHKIARYGINVADVQEIIETAIGGKVATHVFEDVRRFQLILRFPKEQRDSVRAIGNILLRGPAGALIPMSELATIELRDGPVHVSREQVRRRIYIGFNVQERDIGGVVTEGRQKLAQDLVLPPGYSVVWSGAFEGMQRAMARLMVIVPVTIGLIFLLLFLSFQSLRYATLIVMNLPFSVIGGIVALWLTGLYLSVPASVGFIALFGVAVLNGIVLVSYITKLRQQGHATDEAIVLGCELRLRPVLMTATVALFGLLPMAFADGIGAEVQRPLATVVIGGLVSSTLLTLLVLPVLYSRFGEPQKRAAG